VSERLGYVRGEHWTKQWRNLAAQLTDYATSAMRDDRARLLGWAAEAEAAAACPQPCGRIGTAGYATGLVGSAAAGTFAGKDWGVYVFSPAQYPYHDGVWNGPLIVLVDQETWSAAEEFAALLQDNQAAVVMGARTGGAGCGYTWGGTPTVLENSGAVLKLPDCLRYRADGSNEVRGIVPDVPVAIRADDGVELRARMIAEQLPVAIARSRHRKAVEERRRRVAGRERGGPLIGQLRRRSQPARMIDQRIAEPNPQLRVGGIALNRVLEDVDRVRAIAAACKRLGHHQPAFRRREIAEKGMAGLGQRDHVASLAAPGGRAGLAGTALQRIAGRTEQQCRCAGGQRRAANAEQAQRRKARGDQRDEDQPAHQRFRGTRIRRRTSQPPTSSRASGASHNGQAAGSAVGL
jgi:hypothetical protein